MREFRLLQKRLREGNSSAAAHLFNEYSRRLVRLAAANIQPGLVKRFDGEDVVQSVFRTFFRRHREGRFHVEHSQQLWQLLVTLTLCKTRSHARRHTAKRRNARTEQSILDDHEIFDRQPSPEDAVALWEEIDTVLDGLPDRTGEIIGMRLEGRTRSEIAHELSLSRQTIHRILKLVQQRLEQRFVQISSSEATISQKKRDSM